MVALPYVREGRSIGHYERVEDAVTRVRAHRHDGLLGELLDEGEADPRRAQRCPHGTPKLPRRADEGAGPAALPVRRAHEARHTDRLVGIRDDLPARLRN